MNFPLLLPLIVTATLVVAGWYAVHRLSMNRDRRTSGVSFVSNISLRRIEGSRILPIDVI